MLNDRRSIVLNDTEKFNLIMYNSTKEEIEKILEDYNNFVKTRNHSFLRYKFVTNLFSCGEADKTTKELTKELCPKSSIMKRKEPSNYGNVYETLIEYKCYCELRDRNIFNNVQVHEDSLSSFKCALTRINNPEYVFILKIPKNGDNTN